jgi:uncharacterized membrane protein
MKSLYKYFFRGLITILPVALTVYLLYIFLAWMETAALWILRPLIGSFYIPGLGLVFGVLSILVIGYLVSKQSVRKLLSFAEMPFTNLPVVKSIYSSLKSFADYFSPSGKQGEQSVVILRMPGHAMEIVGLITRRSFADLPAGFPARRARGGVFAHGLHDRRLHGVRAGRLGAAHRHVGGRSHALLADRLDGAPACPGASGGSHPG